MTRQRFIRGTIATAAAAAAVGLLAAGCGSTGGDSGGGGSSKASGGTLTVFAAASLTGAFGTIGKQFETAHPGTTVRFSFAGSDALATALEAHPDLETFRMAWHDSLHDAVNAAPRR